MIEFLFVLGSTMLVGWLFPNIWWLYTIPIVVIFFCRGKSGWKSFCLAFLAVFILWLGLTFWYDPYRVVANKMSDVFCLPNSFLLHLASALLGGFVAGLAGLNGEYLRQILMESKKQSSQ